MHVDLWKNNSLELFPRNGSFCPRGSDTKGRECLKEIMKKYLACLAFLSFSLVNAQELEVKDLWFFGKQGIISGQLNPAYSVSTSKVSGNPDTDTETLDVNYQIFYSLMDQLKIGLAPTYSYSKTDGSSAKSGFVEPSIVAQYRLLDGAEAPLYLDLALDFSPALGESENTNQLRGNTQVSLGVKAGQDLGDFAYAVSPRIIYQTTTHNKNAEDSDSTLLYEIAAEAQYDFNEKFSVIGEAAYYVIPDQTNSTTTVENDLVLLAGAGVKYSIIYEMALSLTANYLHSEGNVKAPGFGNFSYKSSGFGAAAKLDFGF